MTSPNRIIRGLETAESYISSSPLSTKLGAALFRGNKFIKGGSNSPGKPKFIGSWTRHAEVNATLNVNAQDGVLFVSRKHALLKSPLLAKPCNHCVEWLTWLGVSKVIYSIPEYPYWEEMEL